MDVRHAKPINKPDGDDPEKANASDFNAPHIIRSSLGAPDDPVERQVWFISTDTTWEIWEMRNGAPRLVYSVTP